MEEKKLLVRELLINYKAFGSGRPSFAKATAGRPVLVLHGWGGKSDSWVEAGELLAAERFRVIIPDLPGFGTSQEPKKAWQFSDYLEWIDDFATALKLERFDLIGHSVGGALACTYAVQHREKIKKLVLCDAAIIREERLDWRQKEAKKLAAKKHLLMKLPFAKQLYPLAQKIVYRLAGVYDYQLATPVMKETFKNLIKVDSREWARKIALPTLIIWGKEDKSTLVGDAYEINKLITGSKLEIIEGAAHNPHKTHAPELVRIIGQFLNFKS